MSANLTLARPYARAAFAAAQEEGTLADWSAALSFAAQVAGDARVAALLPDPRLAEGQAVQLLLPPGGDAWFGNFLGVLADAGRLGVLPEIAALYEQLRAEAERTVLATVTSAAPLPDGELAVIRQALARRFGGRNVELATAVDPALIGGAVIDAGDVVIDGSLKGKLARLQAALAH